MIIIIMIIMIIDYVITMFISFTTITIIVITSGTQISEAKELWLLHSNGSASGRDEELPKINWRKPEIGVESHHVASHKC